MNTNAIQKKQSNLIKVKMIDILQVYCELTKHFPLWIITAFILFLARWMSDSVDSIYSGRPPYMGMTDLNRSFHAWNTSTMYDRMPAENHRRTGCTPEVWRSGQAFFCSQSRGTVQAAPISRVRGGYSNLTKAELNARRILQHGGAATARHGDAEKKSMSSYQTQAVCLRPEVKK